VSTFEKIISIVRIISHLDDKRPMSGISTDERIGLIERGGFLARRSLSKERRRDRKWKPLIEMKLSSLPNMAAN
jgi:hypothetical protein